jgi:hypothetical protein
MRTSSAYPLGQFHMLEVCNFMNELVLYIPSDSRTVGLYCSVMQSDYW